MIFQSKVVVTVNSVGAFGRADEILTKIFWEVMMLTKISLEGRQDVDRNIFL